MRLHDHHGCPFGKRSIIRSETDKIDFMITNIKHQYTNNVYDYSIILAYSLTQPVVQKTLFYYNDKGIIEGETIWEVTYDSGFPSESEK